VAEVRPPEIPFAAIRDMLRWFKSARVSGAVIGGVAVSIQGHPRYTQDLDALVVLDDSNWPAFIAPAAKFGFSARVPDVLEFARQTRMLLLLHDPSGVPLDVSLGCLAFEEELIERAQPVKLRRLTVPIAAPEDLIILKAVAARPQDLADIDIVLSAGHRLDLGRIRKTVAFFAATLERPEIVKQLELLLARHKLPKTR
jgi:predicted nucleotidyltransferase